MAKVEFALPFRGTVGGEKIDAQPGDNLDTAERFLTGLRALGYVKDEDAPEPKPEADTADERETREVEADEKREDEPDEKPDEKPKRGPGRPPKNKTD